MSFTLSSAKELYLLAGDHLVVMRPVLSQLNLFEPVVGFTLLYTKKGAKWTIVPVTLL